jgi:hypothetical protein
MQFRRVFQQAMHGYLPIVKYEAVQHLRQSIASPHAGSFHNVIGLTDHFHSIPYCTVRFGGLKYYGTPFFGTS